MTSLPVASARVFVLTIVPERVESAHDVQTSVHTSRESAMAALVAHVVRECDEETAEGRVPEGIPSIEQYPAEAIEAFFNATFGDYSLREMTVA